MAFQSFWVATSAVGPVIALAAVVALPDASIVGRANNLRARIEQRQLPEKYPGDRAFLVGRARDAAKWASFASLTTVANVIIQASLLVAGADRYAQAKPTQRAILRDHASGLTTNFDLRIPQVVITSCHWRGANSGDTAY